MSDLERIDPQTGEIIPAGASGGALDLPNDAYDLLEKYAGAGYSDKAEDGLTPVLSILQDNSGEVKKQHERYIPGAEAGTLIIRSLRKLYPGDTGLLVQPFGFGHFYVEWTGEVGEGTPVGRFPFYDPPPDMRETQDPQNPTKKIFKRTSTGNRLVDTREHYVNMIDSENSPFPIVIPMSGSNHSSSRLWTNMMKNCSYNGKRLPAFFRLYKLRTVFQKRGGNQTWFKYQLDPAQVVRDRSLLQLGADSFEAMKEKPIEGDLSDMAGGLDDQAPVAQHNGIDPATVI